MNQTTTNTRTLNVDTIIAPGLPRGECMTNGFPLGANIHMRRTIIGNEKSGRINKFFFIDAKATKLRTVNNVIYPLKLAGVKKPYVVISPEDAVQLGIDADPVPGDSHEITDMVIAWSELPEINFDDAFFDKKIETEVKEPNWRCGYVTRDNRFYIRVELTGHQHFGSPYETDSDCGNCNGARCDDCKVVWKISDLKQSDDIFEKEFAIVTASLSDTEEVKDGLKKYLMEEVLNDAGHEQ